MRRAAYRPAVQATSCLQRTGAAPSSLALCLPLVPRTQAQQQRCKASTRKKMQTQEDGRSQVPARHTSDDVHVFPAEFEPHERVWLSWPCDPLETIAGRPFRPVVCDMIQALRPHVKVAVIVNDVATDKQDILAALSSPSSSPSSTLHELEFFAVPHSTMWMRDFGPIFLRPEKKETATEEGVEQARKEDAWKLKVVSFRWNMWGYADRLRAALPAEVVDPVVESDGGVSRRVAQALGLATIEADFVSEGGDREFNGKGVLMVTEAVQLQRNPHLTKEEITERYKRVFNVKKVIWLKRGVVEDEQMFAGPLPGGVLNMPCTGGHIDEYARFVSPSTIVLAQVREEDRDHPIGRISHERLEENFRILADETDQDGNPFTIIRLPLPPIDIIRVKSTDPLFQEFFLYAYDGAPGGPKTFKQLLEEQKIAKGREGDADWGVDAVVPASYCNFLISNGVVLMPRYHTGDGSARDEAIKRADDTAREILQAALPHHQLVQIACENANFGGGGMHCMSQQQPRV